MGVRRLALVGLVAIGALAWVVTRRRGSIDAAAASLRTSSAPSARHYERFGRLIGGLYDRFARETADALAANEAPDVLEIGPGPGELAARLAHLVPDLRYTGLDVDPAMVALARTRAQQVGVADRVRFVVGDVAAMPFEDGSFDVVVSSFSAHHWPHSKAAFAEIRRVLRPGGRAIVYDLPDSWGHLETGSPGLAAAATAGGFAGARPEPVHWPWRLALVRRLVVSRGSEALSVSGRRDPGRFDAPSGGA